MQMEHAGSRGAPSIREASALEAFNAPLFEVPPMLDVRHWSDYLKSHVICAVSAPAEDGLDEAKLLQRILDHDEEWGWCLQHPFFIVYDGLTRDRAEWLSAVLCKAVAARSEVTGFDGADRPERLLRRLAFQCRAIRLLDHAVFAQHFSCCCADGGEWTAASFFDRLGPLPRCALLQPRVFLAGRQVGLTPDLLHVLGVTHVAVNADTWDVMDGTSGGGATAFQALHERSEDVRGLRYLKCDVPDNDTDPDLARIVRVLEGAARFIATCEHEGGACLVRLHGQSRSAAVACAFLMLSRGLSAAGAQQTLEAAGLEVDEKLLWREALERLPAAAAERALEDVGGQRAAAA